MPRATLQPVTQSSDPLADLREPDAPGLTVTVETPEPEPVALYTEEQRDQAISVIIAAWHADTTTQGFLHGGGACGCRYIASVGVRAAFALRPTDE